MVEDKIAEIVQLHYSADDPPLLMLSNLGAQLRKEAIWPVSGDKRSLFAVASAAHGVSLVSDPDARSFIAVVLDGEDDRAIAAIEKRQRSAFIRSLPRVILLAFTLDVAEGQSMFLRLNPTPSYLAGAEAAPEGYLPVEADVRLPGVDISNIEDWPLGEIEALEARIKTWCDRHKVDLLRVERKPTRRPSPPPQSRSSSALERLYEAQTPDIAARLIVPIDIALALSRMS